jgi:hypothetical protein
MLIGMGRHFLIQTRPSVRQQDRGELRVINFCTEIIGLYYFLARINMLSLFPKLDDGKSGSQCGVWNTSDGCGRFWAFSGFLISSTSSSCVDLQDPSFPDLVLRATRNPHRAAVHTSTRCP